MSYGINNESFESSSETGESEFVDLPDSPTPNPMPSNNVEMRQADAAEAAAQQQQTNPNIDMQTLLAALRGFAATQPAAQPAAQPKRKEIAWPKWDGIATSFPFFKRQLEIKIQVDGELMDNNAQAICLAMLQTLPTERQLRVSHWFETGGSLRDWNWRLFLDHFAEQFEDKQAAQCAVEELTRMRQGAHQYFADFLQDFEFKLAQCKGSDWAPNAKIAYLNASINAALKDRLVSKSMPDDDYMRWVSKARAVAGRLENLPGYRPKNSTHIRTWYLRSSGSEHASSVVPSAAVPRIDADGDVAMSGVNALSIDSIAAAVIQAIEAKDRSLEARGNSRGADNRPKAQWKSLEEVRRCIEEGLCIRCAKPGHQANRCPRFRSASRPSSGAARPRTAWVAAAKADKDEEGSDSGKE